MNGFLSTVFSFYNRIIHVTWNTLFIIDSTKKGIITLSLDIYEQLTTRWVTFPRKDKRELFVCVFCCCVYALFFIEDR